MASVTPRVNKDGVVTSYRVQFRINSKVVGESFPTSKAAEDFGKLVDRVGGREAREILARRQNNTGGAPTFAAFADQYLNPASGMLTGIQGDTRDEYRRIADTYLNPVLGDYLITDITKDDIGRWVGWLESLPSQKFRGESIAAKTVKNYHALLSNIFRAAMERGIRPDNPAYRTKLTRGIQHEAVFLSREEFAALHAATPEFYKPYLAFLVGSQLRWSEATALNGHDLQRDTQPPTVRVTKAWKKPDKDHPKPYIGPTKTNRGRRTVSLWDELVDMLEPPAERDGFLLRGTRGGKLWYGSFMSRIWNPSVLRSGIEKRPTPHDLRHTGASWLIADGMPLPFIQNRLGHNSITVTVNTYGHLLPDAHTQMASSLRSTMSGVVRVGNQSERLALSTLEADEESNE